MLNFEYDNKTKIIFGKGTENEVGNYTKLYGKKVLLHYGRNSIKKYGLYDKVVASLKANNIDYVELGGVQANPRLKLAKAGIELTKKENVDFILAVGGGSVIDSAKAIALGHYYDGDVWDFYLKGIRPEKVLPVGVVLTIPAAGSESSTATVISDEETGLKRGYGDVSLRPKFAILNPELTYTLPNYQTSCGVVDIIGHVIERYMTNTTDVELTDRLCESVITTVINNAPKALNDNTDYASRAEIMWAGALAHNGLVGTGREEDWASHGMEHQLSAVYDIAHGAGLAIMYPAWMKFVYKHDLNRFALFANKIFGLEINNSNLEETALKGIAKLEEFYKSIDMPIRMSDINITDENINIMAEKATHTSDIIGSFVKLNKQDIINIYKLAL
ncbi:NADH-dependent butanol dehydrogenase A [Candidatus Izimaplasma bacterium HR1]|jgi:alcohol dehydrogenase YqhD (iron-dependent ADH family)|uniref:iron-containing alcohol dehydrogenase n=1 Tax=Candidatus Izimoplasma sp. HR1 TaxID=1541959 RepID=UPI0004F5B139|nr:NADH-dependent butanol dehydrogenase A [Candidatus Izimaplasma bacterium HR1]